MRINWKNLAGLIFVSLVIGFTYAALVGGTVGFLANLATCAVVGWCWPWRVVSFDD